MTDAELLPRLERTAFHWLGRYPHLAGELDADELVAEGWLAWRRRGTWTRAQGAIRDRLRAAHRDRTRQRELDESRVVVQVPVGAPFEHAPLVFIEESRDWAVSGHVVRPSIVLARHDFERDRQLVRLAAEGRSWVEIGRDVGLSEAQVGYLHRRALLRLESARVAARKRQAARIAS